MSLMPRQLAPAPTWKPDPKARAVEKMAAIEMGVGCETEGLMPPNAAGRDDDLGSGGTN